MLITVSIPDPIFVRAEAFARRRNLSRSALFTQAVDEFVAREVAEDVTGRLNEVYAHESSALDRAWERAQSEAMPTEDDLA